MHCMQLRALITLGPEQRNLFLFLVREILQTITNLENSSIVDSGVNASTTFVVPYRVAQKGHDFCTP